jgi:ABC-type branched-subunit amino acid transport system ATPase component
VLENVKVACGATSTRAALWDCVHPGRASEEDLAAQWVAAVHLSEEANRFPTELSLGQQKLVSIARALARSPQFLLLDEPAAGLSTGDTTDFGRFVQDLVQAYGIGVLLVEHDVGLVTSICDYIYVIDFGQLIAEGNPREILANSAVVRAYLGSEFDRVAVAT